MRLLLHLVQFKVCGRNGSRISIHHGDQADHIDARTSQWRHLPSPHNFISHTFTARMYNISGHSKLSPSAGTRKGAEGDTNAMGGLNGNGNGHAPGKKWLLVTVKNIRKRFSHWRPLCSVLPSSYSKIWCCTPKRWSFLLSSVLTFLLPLHNLLDT